MALETCKRFKNSGGLPLAQEESSLWIAEYLSRVMVVTRVRAFSVYPLYGYATLRTIGEFLRECQSKAYTDQSNSRALFCRLTHPA
jgi:hypothetical protein